jgi:UDP-N-acetylmuramate--alanine ligase
VAFQPHTYSRTQKLFDRFVEELQRAGRRRAGGDLRRPGEEHHRASPPPTCAATSPAPIYCSTLDKVTDKLRELAQPGDLILTVGAGDIYRAGEKLLKEEESE